MSLSAAAVFFFVSTAIKLREGHASMKNAAA
jgi:hypothetical protein